MLIYWLRFNRYTSATMKEQGVQSRITRGACGWEDCASVCRAGFEVAPHAPSSFGTRLGRIGIFVVFLAVVGGSEQ